MLTLEVDVADGIIISADPILGAMHRGAEKLFESRDYRQVLSLANRHEWLSSFTGELGVALLVEHAMGIEAPAHATWLRTLLVEVHRMASHLAFLGGFPWTDEQTALLGAHVELVMRLAAALQCEAIAITAELATIDAVALAVQKHILNGIRWALVLYIVAQFHGGSATGQSEANLTYGSYLALVYAAAIFGGYIADKIIGYQRSILVGAVFMAAGLYWHNRFFIISRRQLAQLCIAEQSRRADLK